MKKAKVMLEFEVEVDETKLEKDGTVLDFIENIKDEIIVVSKVSMTSINVEDNRVMQYNMNITDDMKQFIEKV